MEYFVTQQSIEHGPNWLESYYVTSEDQVYKDMMPIDTLEWRAAEYGFDPVSQLDLLVDVVLYERFFEYLPGQHPLFTMDTAEAARGVHVARVMVAKAQVRPAANEWRTRQQRVDRLRQTGLGKEWVDAIEDDGLAGLKRLSRLDPYFINAKRIGIDRQVREPLRQRARRQPRALSDNENRERLAALYRGDRPTPRKGAIDGFNHHH